MPTCTSRTSASGPGRRCRAALCWLGLAAAAPSPALALPDDTPWGRNDGEACHDCHFLEPVVESSEALSLSGLPEAFMSGKTYRLVLELEAPDMRRAGFRVIAETDAGPKPGRFESLDAMTEADGDRVRSTLEGSELDAPGEAGWTFVWQAPERTAGPVVFEVSANAADDDASPLGDVIHRRRFTIAPAAAD